jgi:hypothetical protein
MLKINDSELPNFDIQEFYQRWTKARISAIKKSAPESTGSELSSEPELLEQYFSNSNDSKKNDILLRNIFDHSRQLALGLSKFLKISFEIQDFQNLLEQSSIPCVQGKWENRETARILSRKGCDFCPKVGANACDYWREALDGLVMGLGEKERLARHASVRHGDDSCIDIFYTEAPSRKENILAYGPLPDHMEATLTTVSEDFEIKMKKAIVLKGLSEGVLYFEFATSTDALCGGTQLLTSTFQRKIQQHYPGLLVKEISPCAVLGVET